MKHISDGTLRLLFEDSPLGILVFKPNGAAAAANPAALAMFGYSRRQMLGKKSSLLVKGSPSGETMGIRKNGDEFPLHVSVSGVAAPDGRAEVWIVRDNSGMRETAAQLEASENRFQAVIETAVDGIIIINRKGIIQMVNPAAAQLFEYTAKELEGKNVNFLMPEPYHSEHDGYIHNYRTTRRAKIIGIGREVTGRKKSGIQFPMKLGVSEFMVDGESFFAGIIHDLTEQRRAEKALRRLNQNLEKKVLERTDELAEVVNELLFTNKKLKGEINERKLAEKELLRNRRELEKALEQEKELNELKSRFVSTASHEFRTPLSTILSSSAIIQRYTTEEQQGRREKHTNRIKAAVIHLNGILNDFLSLSKLEEGLVEPKFEETEWLSFCSEILETIDGILKSGQQISYENNIPRKQTVYIDYNMMRNVLFNLLSNAIKYSPEDGEIILRTYREDDVLRIEVQDFGIGIPEKNQAHLFRRFFRADNAANIQGTGLGLNIVKRYIKLMGGNITFISKEGEGTVFYANLPFREKGE